MPLVRGPRRCRLVLNSQTQNKVLAAEAGLLESQNPAKLAVWEQAWAKMLKKRLGFSVGEEGEVLRLWAGDGQLPAISPS